jgi:hypothetical protein
MNNSNQALIVALCGATLCGGLAAAAQAQQECYDFENLAADARFTVGDVVEARHATVTIRQYVTNGNPATADARHAQVASSQIAGGAPPELGLYLVAVEVVPDQPVSRVRTRLAQSISQTGGFANANIRVNGEKHESADGFAAMDGKTIGKPAKGLASISADLPDPASGNWHSGTLELVATQGAIESFTLGAHTWRIDDMCFEL